jgi:uncharacterized protein YlxW (UPF0749 family)
MENTFPTGLEPETDAECEAAVDLLLDEMRRHQDQMQRNRLEIERLRAESQAIGRHTDSVLADLQRRLDLLQHGRTYGTCRR